MKIVTIFECDRLGNIEGTNDKYIKGLGGDMDVWNIRKQWQLIGAAQDKFMPVMTLTAR